jgi:hypothetical protein
MSKLRSLPAAAKVVIGVVLASVLAPAAAVAATNLVGIIGSNGARASVTKAGQLQATEAAPASFKSFFANVNSACNHVLTVPSTKGLVLRQAVFDNLSVTSPGPGTFAGLYLNDPTCSGFEGKYFIDENPAGTGVVTIPFEPGFALKHGTKLYVRANNVLGDLFVYGYLVPASDVPSTTPFARIHSGFAPNRK